jgi:addiction module RelE/StbE family toxin
MWEIYEHRSLVVKIRKLPSNIVKKYEFWKSIITEHGPKKLKEFPGFRDEKLSGNLSEYRSSRLSLKYRVIYEVNKKEVSIYVIDINSHDYKK